MKFCFVGILNTVPGFTREVVEKWKKFNPKTIEEDKKIPGITPAAIMNLHVYIQKKKKERKVIVNRKLEKVHYPIKSNSGSR